MFTPTKLAPCGNIVVCIKVSPPCEQLKSKNNLFYVEKEDGIPEFKIIDMHFLTESDKNGFRFGVGDIVYSGATGTTVKLNNGTEYYLFNPEYILGKIDN